MLQSSSDKTPYDLIGGAETIAKLVDAFYDRVAVHPDLIPIFPEDLTETREKQYLFLTQFFGGPLLYSEQHGHPMLRARHIPFPITPKRAEAWLSCMEQAMEHIGLKGPIRDFMFERLTQTAYHMVNRPPED
ncbi:globin [Ammoniphilus sp. CFH 90114]|uniref:globin domain-containing protein n=1 Tax=Ammoniphilus sp. CFH 90114 TaxID=2493665 RepID=UPI00100E5908|nr:globin [Ammoniphilus sp. CFH 90114]RXT08122.1 globin [Ammoniphilus sp. CFH 90114]